MSGWGSLREGGWTPAQLQSLAIPILSISNWDYADRVNTETMLVAGAWEGGKGKALSYFMIHRLRIIVTYQPLIVTNEYQSDDRHIMALC